MALQRRLLDGAMNLASFGACVEHELAPTLKPGQIVIADNLAVIPAAPARDSLGIPKASEV